MLRLNDIIGSLVQSGAQSRLRDGGNDDDEVSFTLNVAMARMPTARLVGRGRDLLAASRGGLTSDK